MITFRFTTTLAISFALVAGLTQASLAQTAAAGALSDSSKAALSKQLAESVSHGETPGVVAVIVGPDGVLYEGAAGKLDAHDKAMRVNAIFSIASMTKPVTSVAIMMLVERGKLKLDDPVSMYLPGFDHEQVITSFNQKDATYETRPAKRPITIRHLLTHTSGIGYGFSNEIENRLTKKTSKQEWELPLLNDPGDQWHYGPNTLLLGLIVEKLSGQSLEAYFQEHIFKPLGMVDTSFAVPQQEQARVAAKYTRSNGRLKEIPQRRPIPATPVGPFHGDGGLYSTAQDYGRFMQMLLDGGSVGTTKVLSESSVHMMAENNIGPVVVELQPGVDAATSGAFPIGAGKDKFGLGLQITAADPRYAGFRSPGSLSWAGIFNTEFWIDPVRHIAGVMMMQVLPFYDEKAIKTLRDFEGLVYRSVP